MGINIILWDHNLKSQSLKDQRSARGFEFLVDAWQARGPGFSNIRIIKHLQRHFNCNYEQIKFN